MAEELPSTRNDPRRRWAARASLLILGGIGVFLIAVAGAWGAIGLLVITVICAVVAICAAFWFVTRGGVLRWAAAFLVVVAIGVVGVAFIWTGLLVEVIAAAAAGVVAVVCARCALRVDTVPGMPELPAAAVGHPFLIMNPHSGDGKVEKFDLVRRAEELGAEVALLEGPGVQDVTRLARDALARGADLLGVAGGDGTQALVAGVAADHGVPFMVITAGTRNHFAADLGLDRDDPARCLDALTDGVELRVDLGRINGRRFVNNASFGVYAEIVESDGYRDAKTSTAITMLPDLVADDRTDLVVRAGDSVITGPHAILVSNNPYGRGGPVAMTRRDRLDTGVLGVITVSVTGARTALGIFGARHTEDITRHAAGTVVVDGDGATIPVGVDGEALELRTPVRCEIEPGVLRVRVPRERPGVTPVTHLQWRRLWRVAWPRARS
ncbi:diacylglycerol kinase [Gordonia desulfuricans]|uniref:Diacylglycerol kinase n=1 Tax=Gordonia desulfuricans TaxID=89051 RepID=A0A7K3LMC1_9ACTN|nr:diacylglycerol kinase family protein [Gordonia desulfuricans]NDK88657.1 diacylglycerol kinase [Gordonia desulfuricans]